MLQTHGRVRGVSLRELFPKAKFVGAQDIRITSCCSDPRSVQPGDLFVALLGAELDGHDLVRQAIERGAAAVLCERLLPVSLPQCLVGNSHDAYGRICQALAGSPSQQLRTVGITGSNGKTVTAMLLAGIFSATREGVGILSSLGYSDGVKTQSGNHLTPSAPELADWLARSMANGCGNVVLEVSSQSLAERRLAGVQLDAAVLTNLRRDHVDDHGSLLNVRKLKGRLFKHLKPHGFVVLNADDPGSQHFLTTLEQPTITIGMRERAEVMASVLDRSPSEQTFLLTAGNETIPVRTQMIGDHHIYNCLAATAVGLVLGIDLTTIVRGLEAVDFVPGRMERLECGQSFSVFVDGARTPDSLAASLKTLRQVTRGRVIAVCGAEGETDHSQRSQIGSVLERYAHASVLTSQNPRNETPLQIIHDLLDGYSSPGKAHVLPDRAAAIRWALSKARPGDSVLIAGKGDETLEHIGGKKYPWDDRELAKHWLYDQAKTELKSNPHGLKIVG